MPLGNAKRLTAGCRLRDPDPVDAATRSTSGSTRCARGPGSPPAGCSRSRRCATVDVRWHVMSLAVLNEGRETARGVPRADAAGLGPGAGRHRRRSSSTATRCSLPLYTALGNRFHLEKRPKDARRSRPRWPRSACRLELADAADDRRATTRRCAPATTTAWTGSAWTSAPRSSPSRARVLRPGRHPDPAGRGRRPALGRRRARRRVDGFFELKRSRDPRPDLRLTHTVKPRQTSVTSSSRCSYGLPSEQRLVGGPFGVVDVGLVPGAVGEGQHVHLGGAVLGAQPPLEPAAVPLQERQRPCPRTRGSPAPKSRHVGDQHQRQPVHGPEVKPPRPCVDAANST